MGRWITGAQITAGAKTIELSYLVNCQLLQKGLCKSGKLRWSINGQPTGNIGIETRYLGDGCDFIRLYYSHTKDEIKTELDYKIHLIEKDSNLGKGKVLYMICCQSGYLCRNVYMAYGSAYFKCRKAYQNRLYYPIQKSSKLDRANSRFFDIEDYFAKENKKRKTHKYNGVITKRAKRNQRLEIQHSQMDYLRSQSFLHGCRKILGKNAFF